jgi:hypothetical protein
METISKTIGVTILTLIAIGVICFFCGCMATLEIENPIYGKAKIGFNKD